MKIPDYAGITVLTVDDHPLMREFVAGAVESQSDMTVVGQAAGGLEAIELHRLHRPDVTLMDIQMPDLDGISALIAIRDEFPTARVLMLTTHLGDVQASRALEAGAAGYLLKEMPRTTLLDAIRVVHGGDSFVPEAVRKVIAGYANNNPLSAREVAVLQQVAEGQSNKHVARTLTISEDTVKTHIRSILSKLGALDRTHAVTIALQRGIVGT